jgi:hypothetical protein
VACTATATTTTTLSATSRRRTYQHNTVKDDVRNIFVFAERVDYCTMQGAPKDALIHRTLTRRHDDSRKTVKNPVTQLGHLQRSGKK